MRYICRTWSVHNSHKFVSMFVSAFKALQPFQEREGGMMKGNQTVVMNAAALNHKLNNCYGNHFLRITN